MNLFQLREVRDYLELQRQVEAERGPKVVFMNPSDFTNFGNLLTGQQRYAVDQSDRASFTYGNARLVSVPGFECGTCVLAHYKRGA